MTLAMILRWNPVPNQKDTCVADTPAGRYLIRREAKGSRVFRAYFNGKPTTYSGTLAECKATVERIAASPPAPRPNQHDRTKSVPAVVRQYRLVDKKSMFRPSNPDQFIIEVAIIVGNTTCIVKEWSFPNKAEADKRYKQLTEA